jgi:hypothetical protein
MMQPFASMFVCLQDDNRQVIVFSQGPSTLRQPATPHSSKVISTSMCEAAAARPGYSLLMASTVPCAKRLAPSTTWQKSQCNCNAKLNERPLNGGHFDLSLSIEQLSATRQDESQEPLVMLVS